MARDPNWQGFAEYMKANKLGPSAQARGQQEYFANEVLPKLNVQDDAQLQAEYVRWAEANPTPSQAEARASREALTARASAAIKTIDDTSYLEAGFRNIQDFTAEAAGGLVKVPGTIASLAGAAVRSPTLLDAGAALSEAGEATTAAIESRRGRAKKDVREYRQQLRAEGVLPDAGIMQTAAEELTNPSAFLGSQAAGGAVMGLGRKLAAKTALGVEAGGATATGVYEGGSAAGDTYQRIMSMDDATLLQTFGSSVDPDDVEGSRQAIAARAAQVSGAGAGVAAGALSRFTDVDLGRAIDRVTGVPVTANAPAGLLPRMGREADSLFTDPTKYSVVGRTVGGGAVGAGKEAVEEAGTQLGAGLGELAYADNPDIGAYARDAAVAGVLGAVGGVGQSALVGGVNRAVTALRGPDRAPGQTDAQRLAAEAAAAGQRGAPAAPAAPVVDPAEAQAPAAAQAPAPTAAEAKIANYAERVAAVEANVKTVEAAAARAAGTPDAPRLEAELALRQRQLRGLKAEAAAYQQQIDDTPARLATVSYNTPDEINARMYELKTTEPTLGQAWKAVASGDERFAQIKQGKEITKLLDTPVSQAVAQLSSRQLSPPEAAVVDIIAGESRVHQRQLELLAEKLDAAKKAPTPKPVPAAVTPPAAEPEPVAPVLLTPSMEGRVGDRRKAYAAQVAGMSDAELSDAVARSAAAPEPADPKAKKDLADQKAAVDAEAVKRVAAKQKEAAKQAAAGPAEDNAKNKLEGRSKKAKPEPKAEPKPEVTPATDAAPVPKEGPKQAAEPTAEAPAANDNAKNKLEGRGKKAKPEATPATPATDAAPAPTTVESLVKNLVESLGIPTELDESGRLKVGDVGPDPLQRPRGHRQRQGGHQSFVTQHDLKRAVATVSQWILDAARLGESLKFTAMLEKTQGIVDAADVWLHRAVYQHFRGKLAQLDSLMSSDEEINEAIYPEEMSFSPAQATALVANGNDAKAVARAKQMTAAAVRLGGRAAARLNWGGLNVGTTAATRGSLIDFLAPYLRADEAVLGARPAEPGATMEMNPSVLSGRPVDLPASREQNTVWARLDMEWRTGQATAKELFRMQAQLLQQILSPFSASPAEFAIIEGMRAARAVVDGAGAVRVQEASRRTKEGNWADKSAEGEAIRKAVLARDALQAAYTRMVAANPDAFDMHHVARMYMEEQANATLRAKARAALVALEGSREERRAEADAAREVAARASGVRDDLGHWSIPLELVPDIKKRADEIFAQAQAEFEGPDAEKETILALRRELSRELTAARYSERTLAKVVAAIGDLSKIDGEIGFYKLVLYRLGANAAPYALPALKVLALSDPKLGARLGVTGKTGAMHTNISSYERGKYAKDRISFAVKYPSLWAIDQPRFTSGAVAKDIESEPVFPSQQQLKIDAGAVSASVLAALPDGFSPAFPQHSRTVHDAEGKPKVIIGKGVTATIAALLRGRAHDIDDVYKGAGFPLRLRAASAQVAAVRQHKERMFSELWVAVAQRNLATTGGVATDAAHQGMTFKTVLGGVPASFQPAFMERVANFRTPIKDAPTKPGRGPAGNSESARDKRAAAAASQLPPSRYNMPRSERNTEIPVSGNPVSQALKFAADALESDSRASRIARQEARVAALREELTASPEDVGTQQELAAAERMLDILQEMTDLEYNASYAPASGRLAAELPITVPKALVSKEDAIGEETARLDARIAALRASIAILDATETLAKAGFEGRSINVPEVLGRVQAYVTSPEIVLPQVKLDRMSLPSGGTDAETGRAVTILSNTPERKRKAVDRITKAKLAQLKRSSAVKDMVTRVFSMQDEIRALTNAPRSARAGNMQASLSDLTRASRKAIKLMLEDLDEVRAEVSDRLSKVNRASLEDLASVSYLPSGHPLSQHAAGEFDDVVVKTLRSISTFELKSVLSQKMSSMTAEGYSPGSHQDNYVDALNRLPDKGAMLADIDAVQGMSAEEFDQYTANMPPQQKQQLQIAVLGSFGVSDESAVTRAAERIESVLLASTAAELQSAIAILRAVDADLSERGAWAHSQTDRRRTLDALANAVEAGKYEEIFRMAAAGLATRFVNSFVSDTTTVSRAEVVQRFEEAGIYDSADPFSGIPTLTDLDAKELGNRSMSIPAALRALADGIKSTSAAKKYRSSTGEYLRAQIARLSARAMSPADRRYIALLQKKLEIVGDVITEISADGAVNLVAGVGKEDVPVEDFIATLRSQPLRPTHTPMPETPADVAAVSRGEVITALSEELQEPPVMHADAVVEQWWNTEFDPERSVGPGARLVRALNGAAGFTVALVEQDGVMSLHVAMRDGPNAVRPMVRLIKLDGSVNPFAVMPRGAHGAVVQGIKAAHAVMAERDAEQAKQFADRSAADMYANDADLAMRRPNLMSTRTGKGSGMPAAEVRNRLVRMFGTTQVAKWESAGALRVVQHPHEINVTLHGDDSPGKYSPETGTVFLVADNLSPEAVYPVLLHELGGHQSWEGLFGDARTRDRLMNQIAALRDSQSPAVSAQVRAAEMFVLKNYDLEVESEEFFEETVMKLVQDHVAARGKDFGPIRAFVNGAVQAVRAHLIRNGWMNITNVADIVAVMEGSMWVKRMSRAPAAPTPRPGANDGRAMDAAGAAKPGAKTVPYDARASKADHMNRTARQAMGQDRTYREVTAGEGMLPLQAAQYAAKNSAAQFRPAMEKVLAKMQEMAARKVYPAAVHLAPGSDIIDLSNQLIRSVASAEAEAMPELTMVREKVLKALRDRAHKQALNTSEYAMLREIDPQLANTAHGAQVRDPIYALRSNTDLLASALSDPEVVGVLRSIQISPKPNAFSDFVAALMKVFGIADSEETAFTQIIAAADKTLGAKPKLMSAKNESREDKEARLREMLAEEDAKKEKRRAANPRNNPSNLSPRAENVTRDDLPARFKRGMETFNRVVGARPKILGVMQMDHIDEAHGGRFQPVRDLYHAFNAVDTAVTRMLNEGSKLFRKWDLWERAVGEDGARRLNALMLNATFARVFPDRAYTDRIAFERDHPWHEGNELAWRKQQQLAAEYGALGDDGREVYGAVQTYYRKQLEHMRTATEARLRAINEPGPELEAQLRMLTRRFRAAEQGPYFPLKRWGKFVVHGTRPSPTGPVPVNYSFDTNAEATEALAELRSRGYDVKLKQVSEVLAGDFQLEDPTLRAMHKKLSANIKTSDPDKRAAKEAALMEQLRNVQMMLSPEAGALSGTLSRKYVEGASEEMKRGFAQSVYSSAHYIARTEHGHLVSEAIAGMQELRQQAEDTQSGTEYQSDVQRLHDEMLNRYAMYTQPPSAHTAVSRVYNTLQQATAFYMLTSSLSYVLLNATQTLTFSLPLLASRHGLLPTTRALTKAGATAAALDWSSFVRDFAGRFDPEFAEKRPEMMLRAVIEKSDALKDGEREMLLEGLDTGKLEISIWVDMIGAADPRTKTGDAFSWVVNTSAVAPHHSEIFNRLTTALAAYRLEKAQGRSEASARAYAWEANRKTHFQYSDLNKSRYLSARNYDGEGLQRFITMLGQFQSFRINSVFRIAWEANKGLFEAQAKKELRGLSPEQAEQEVHEARWFLGYQAGMTVLFAGALGLPFAYTAIYAAEAIANALPDMGDDDEDEEKKEVLGADFKRGMRMALAESMGPEAADYALYGFTRYFGADMHGRVGLQALLPGFADYNAAKETNPGDFITPMLADAAHGVPAMGLLMRLNLARELAMQGDRGEEALITALPKGLSDLAKYGRDERWQSFSGNRQPYELTDTERMIGMFGIRPTRIAHWSEAVGNSVRRNKEAKTIIEKRALAAKLALENQIDEEMRTGMVSPEAQERVARRIDELVALTKASDMVEYADEITAAIGAIDNLAVRNIIAASMPELAGANPDRTSSVLEGMRQGETFPDDSTRGALEE